MHPTFIKCQELLETKSQDYNGMAADDCDPARRIYFPYDDKSYLHMIHTKIERIKQTHEGMVHHESTMDSVLDAINYLAFYAAFLETKDY